ncbi:MAG: Lipolytic protein G-D-S-L family [Candidatus Gottesmanbacteria bacterium GW2011_GWA2_43_14]|uniref:Lipolytic protein G-D-S-L family n=1 Tax=Candidatus Gottesmanbacteria bacterium GW2011_GWA2_43_14 TaxID=1618443 RepID=A0A0G1DKP0_9BACT|nr:MAG: Lipolytic protein G-D-S-L family [Candidatus Gottesmanbacteria bacterium GW2011_GWA2_43_14]
MIRKVKPISFKLLLIIIISASLFLLLELTMIILTDRKILSDYKPLIINYLAKKNSDNGDWRLFHIFQEENYEVDEKLFWAPKKNSHFYNEDRFITRLSDRKEDNKRKITIITYGDSNTQGNEKISWALELGKELERKFDNIKVDILNAGVAGYSSYQGVNRLKDDLKKFRPQIIIFSFGWNDAAFAAGPVDKYYQLQNSLLENKLLNLHTYSVIKYHINKAGEKFQDERTKVNIPRVPSDEYQENLNLFIDIAADDGFYPVLLTRPFMNSDTLNRQFFDQIQKNNEAVLKISEHRSALAIDIRKEFGNNPGLFIDQSHFTNEGHKQAAKFIAGKLAEDRNISKLFL